MFAMTELGNTPFPVLVSRGTRLSLVLYDIAANIEKASRDICRVATGIASFSRTAKHLDLVLNEDESIPTSQAHEAVQSIIYQADQILDEFEALFLSAKAKDSLNSLSWKWGLLERARTEYLLGHLCSLRLTSATMIQSFSTVNVKRLSKQHNDYAMQKAVNYVEDEELQLEILVIEQQNSILRAYELHQEYTRSESFSNRESEKVLLSQEEMSMSSIAQGFFDQPAKKIAAKEAQDVVPPGEKCIKVADGQWKPSKLKAKSLLPFRASALSEYLCIENEFERLTAIRRASNSHTNAVLQQWTRLGEIEERLQRYTAQAGSPKQLENTGRQASIETALPSRDEANVQVKAQPSTAKIAAPVPRRAPSSQSIFTQASFIVPISVPGSNLPSHLNTSSYPVSSRNSFSFASQSGNLPISPAHSYKSAEYISHSPRSSVHSNPSTRAAAVAIRNEAETGDDLEIPWRLCLHNSYWDYIDGRCVDSNTHLQPSEAYNNRKGYTELLASWVCRRALDEAPHDHTQVQKPDASGRKLETAYIVHKPLRFDEVEWLVERTIQILQQESELPRKDQSSHRQRRSIDRQDTRSRRNSKITSQLPTVQQHPPLDRSVSMPVGTTLTPHISTSPGTGFYNVGQPYTPYMNPNLNPQYTVQRSTTSTNGYGEPPSVVSDIGSSDSEDEKKGKRRAARKAKKTTGRSHSAVGTMAKIGGALAILEGLEHAF
ncbi:hypothetical protein EJ05DRAFT_60781 [Pseudovirgaria hyperparasitica]|uniref:Fungal N-terminal domain-containing protein n=1 Tax=Pseudovirgaria hyperparasitica TaxID=470096 RepID=A0A6A6W333_9PEZI|nr:uncharacterized protein EJ05DRAFT_60781 [Pseudovirgaria hyperparasitica]KAF2757262.1 hypothetical protein EJ05DRAFT_60781 [Pseudovirgaria hyperparasitica]